MVLNSKSTLYGFISKVQIHLLSFWIKGSANFDLFFEMKAVFWSYFVNLSSANILRETPSNTSFQDKYWFEMKKILLKNQKSL